MLAHIIVYICLARRENFEWYAKKTPRFMGHFF